MTTTTDPDLEGKAMNGLEILEKRGEERGEERGEKRGRFFERVEIVQGMLKEGLSSEGQQHCFSQHLEILR